MEKQQQQQQQKSDQKEKIDEKPKSDQKEKNDEKLKNDQPSNHGKPTLSARLSEIEGRLSEMVKQQNTILLMLAEQKELMLKLLKMVADKQ